MTCAYCDCAVGRPRRRAVSLVAAESTSVEVRSSVHIASMVDVDDFDSCLVVIDSVDYAVAPAAGRSQPGQLATQRTTEPLGILGERAEGEFQAGNADLLG